MLGAYEKDGLIVPVEILTKERYSDENNIYVEVSLNEMKKGSTIIDINTSNEIPTSTQLPYEISV